MVTENMETNAVESIEAGAAKSADVCAAEDGDISMTADAASIASANNTAVNIANIASANNTSADITSANTASADNTSVDIASANNASANIASADINANAHPNMIEIDGVSMRFHLSDDRIFSLKEFITRKAVGKLTYSDFWALQDVTFTVKKGEVMGIIGRNGAGKSTLLKVISGILKPTKGGVVCHGNVVPMLELGSGFDMDLTGRENVFLNGAVLGYSEEYLKSKFDEILEFSELGQFIDVPIRNYSSGMLARLAFSVATEVRPEILIVDEILSVGDESFQQKSRARMQQLMGGGTTVLFVSHALGQIREMCDRVVWLEKGQMKMIGATDEVCEAYGRQ